MTVKLAVLFSGGGRTILNLLDHIEDGKLDATISIAIASRNDITGIDRIANRNIDVAVANQEGDSSEIIDTKVQNWLRETNPDLVLLCGYLRLLKIEPWLEGRVLNIHPALLPKYGGKGMFGINVHSAVIASGDSTSGCTVHYVDNQYDNGPTILQLTCEVKPSDTPEILAERVFSLECDAYPEAIKMVARQLKVRCTTNE